MRTGDKVMVYPHGQPDLASPARVTIISKNGASIAVGFLEKPPFPRRRMTPSGRWPCTQSMGSCSSPTAKCFAKSRGARGSNYSAAGTLKSRIGMNNPLTRADLDKMPCGTPGCTHDTCQMFFHGRCHPHADLEAS